MNNISSNVRRLRELVAMVTSINTSHYSTVTRTAGRKLSEVSPLAISTRKLGTDAASSSDLCVSCLKQRTLVRVAGSDAAPFLQGLITNDMNLLNEDTPGHTKSMYTLILSVQGRVLYDIIAYNITGESNTPCYLLECDAQVTEEFIKVMKKYKIRRKVDISDVSSEMQTWAVFQKEGMSNSEAYTRIHTNMSSEIIASTADPRLGGFGRRLITNSDADVSRLLGAPPGEENAYSVHRHRWGLGEGVIDHPPGNCFPLETNVEFLNGVSFSKGCYIGQELTARTYHTGVTRKRLMPIVIQNENIDLTDADSLANNVGKSSGKFRSASGKYGLALLRINDVMGKQPLVIRDSNKKALTEAEAHVPSWWILDNDDVLKRAIEKHNSPP